MSRREEPHRRRDDDNGARKRSEDLTQEERAEMRMCGLSDQVGKACSKWLAERGIHSGQWSSGGRDKNPTKRTPPFKPIIPK